MTQTPQAMMKAIVANIEKVIVGKREAVESLLIALLCRGHVLIEDVPGVGKTTLVSALARSVDATFKRIQFTPDILPSDITGFSLPNPHSGQFEYRPGLVLSNFVLADEINRTSPKTQAALLEAMEEGQVSVDGVTRVIGPPFMVMATQNPIEYVGTYPLPEAQMDRFFMRLSMGYPSPHEEVSMLAQRKTEDPIDTLGSVCHVQDVLELQQMTSELFIREELAAYIVALIAATRAHPSVRLGASPRGSLALYRAAQASAFYQNRTFVLPDDIQRMAPFVLPHRILLKGQAQMKGVTQEQVVAEVLTSVAVPE